MEATDVFLEELTVDGLVDGALPTIHKLERKLFEAIKKGDLEKVKNALNYSQPKCNLNCVNNSGKTVLQVAADLEDVSIRNDIIKSLLSGGADLELALLHAVRENNLKCVETLLIFQEPPSVQPDTLNVTHSSKHERYITPLILAACLQKFQIVKLLLENGFAIADLPADNSQRSHGVEGEKLAPAVFRLNRYRALASPEYIAASFLLNSHNGPDPVYQACVLNKELREMAEQEYEFRKEYLELSDSCKEFAVAVLNECRSMKEIRCVMEMKSDVMLPDTGGGLLNILEFAIVTRNEKVCFPFFLCN